MRFAFIEAHEREWALTDLCRVLDVSRSGFHAWRTRGLSPHQRRDEQLAVEVVAIHERSRKTYGSPRVALGGYQPVYLPYDPLGASQLPLQYCATAFGLGTFGLMARFRGAACAPGPLASVGPQLGSGCGGSPLQLASTTPPVLGSTWDVTLFGGPPAAGMSVYLFWSLGVNSTGTPIAAGNSCLTYLDLASLGSLNAIGAEPIATGTLSSLGFIIWTALVPSSPTVAGTLLGIQAIVISSAGTIPLGGGQYGEVSNGLQLTLGY